MKGMLKLVVPMLALIAGCQTYTWTSSVPADMRTVSVPTFRNNTTVTELGSVVTRQVLREFQREGTFRIAPVGEAALEIQGTVQKSTDGVIAIDRRTGGSEREFRIRAVISVIDKRNGKVLVDNRSYSARTTFPANGDVLTSKRDASGRVADDLARQIVDDVLSRKW